MIEIDIAVPVYNEEKRLERGIVTLHEHCTKRGLSFHISIADNGSRDRTLELARELSSRLAGIRVVHVSRKGVGAALVETWDSSQARFVGYMDVDLSTDLSHLDEVLSLLRSGKADVVNGSRLLPGSKVEGRKLSREISSRGFNILLKTLLGVGFTDGMCGFKFLTTDAYAQLREAGLKNREWFFNAEVLVVADWIGLGVREIPVRWKDDPASKAKIMELARKYTKEILRLRAEREHYVSFSRSRTSSRLRSGAPP